MSNYRNNLPQMTNEIFLTDGGLETYLVFHEGIDLPHFAALDILSDQAKIEIVKSYYRQYLDIAAEAGTGFILDAVTWRGNRDWGLQLGLNPASLKQANKHAVALIAGMRAEYAGKIQHIVLNGVIGPRGDGYEPGNIMTATEAADYHTEQIATFAETEADMVSAITMTNSEEAIGIVRAAQAFDLPVIISFTTETDGRLPTGQDLGEAIEQVDAATGAAPAYYMVNCAHPSHFSSALASNAAWLGRLKGVRTNASKLSHAELDEAEQLDEGNPGELGAENADLRALCPSLNVFGGCCGTDLRHVTHICKALAA